VVSEKCEFCGKVVFMSTFGLTCLECDQNRIRKLEAALERIRDCDFVITLPDRMDAVRAIAREALE
jgi:hypothetical protein